jgi:Bacterial PH domain
MSTSHLKDFGHDDYAAEPDPAAPGQLPRGETIVWQGRPDGLSLAWRVYHLREVTAYFGVLISWRLVSSWWDTGLASKVMASTLPLVLPFTIAALLLLGLGFLSAKTTRYTITNRRIVMRTGVAMPTTLNLPFTAVSAANHRDYGKGLIIQDSGDIGIEISDAKLAYLMLWPHVRPWALRHPQPMMRCVPESATVAHILVQALSGEAVVAATNLEKRAAPALAKPTSTSQVLDGHFAA